VAVASGTLGTWLALRALGIGPGHEVIASPYGWQQVAHAVTLAGATLVLSEIDYWSGCLDAARAEPLVTPATRAVIVGNVNGHPADWDAWRALASRHGLALIEDSTEAIGSVYRGRAVGSFGDVSVFDFASPSLLACGEGGLLLTDDAALATELRYLRNRSLADRRSVSVGARVPLQAGISEITAALPATAASTALTSSTSPATTSSRSRGAIAPALRANARTERPAARSASTSTRPVLPVAPTTTIIGSPPAPLWRKPADKNHRVRPPPT
jgi:hypothetical protein